MRVAVVGCGKIGEKRAQSLGNDDHLTFCVDKNIDKAQILAKKYVSGLSSDYKEVCSSNFVDVVIASTTNNMLFPVAMEAIRNNKHVLIEKPAGMNSGEIQQMIEASKKYNVTVMVGYNHREHPALLKAKKVINEGEIGAIMYIVARYCHGGAFNENSGSWRLDPRLSSGGELIEKSCHLIDLSRWFFDMRKDELFAKVGGVIKTYYRNSLEDNTFLNLETNLGQIAFLHGSCTDWRNTFEFSIYGTEGKIDINGLGGSYGIENLTFSQMRKDSIKPLVLKQEFLDDDNSWSEEWKKFKHCIEFESLPESNLYTALETMRVVERVYDLNGVER
jgi:predicted dehydrogenase